MYVCSNSIFFCRRFITLIDALYEHRCNVIITAEGPPESLFVTDEDPKEVTHPIAVSDDELINSAAQEEIFAYRRTISRLSEMQTDKYKKLPHKK